MPPPPEAVDRTVLDAFVGGVRASGFEPSGETSYGVGGYEVECLRPTAFGGQALVLHEIWRRRSWRLRLMAITRFVVPREGADLTLSFRVMPECLDPSVPSTWRWVPREDPAPVLDGLLASCEGPLRRFFDATATPEGLVRFMAEEYRPWLFVSPSIALPLRAALRVADLLNEPDREVARRALSARAAALGLSLLS